MKPREATSPVKRPLVNKKLLRLARVSRHKTNGAKLPAAPASKLALRRRPDQPAQTAALRSSAEQHLVRLHLNLDQAGEETNEHRLVHELQVHQVELEMQNVELLDARSRTEALLEKYTDLYEFAPVGYLSFTAEGRIQLINLTGASQLGPARSQLVGQLLGPHIHADHRADFHGFLRRVFTGSTKQSCEVLLAGPGLPPRAVNIGAQRLPHALECRAVMHDITERRQATEKMRISEVRYRRLFEAAHDGVLLLAPVTGQITDANPFMTRLLGYSREQLVGKQLFEIGLLKDEGASREMFRQLKRNHEVRYEDLPLESQDGRHQEVEVVANLYQENGHAVIQCNIRDITERKRAQDELRRSEERFRTLFELSPTGVYFADASGLIQAFNQQAVTLWGRRPGLEDKAERFCGSHRLFLLGGKFLPHRKCPMAQVLRGQVPEVRDAEVMIERPDGSRITCSVSIRPLRDAKGKITGAINCFYDITERKEAEAIQRKLLSLAAANLAGSREITRRRKVETSLRKSERSQRALLMESRLLHSQMRHLTRQIITAQEEERKKISRELHDDVMQTLVGINASLGALTKQATVDPANLKRKIAHTHRLVKSSVDAVHRFARALRPAVLDDFGLVPALQLYLKDLAARIKFQVRLTAPEELADLDNSKQTVLFRVAQEALANVARHARATRVELRLTEIPGAVRMEVHDNGKSFRVKSTLAAKKYKRLGLLGMRERVEMVGGVLVIESSPRRGTLVRAEIPTSPGETPA